MSEAPPVHRSRWRRLTRLCLWLAGIALVLRVALWLALPWILGRVAAGLDLAIRTERLELALLEGRLEVWGLEVRGTAARAGEPGFLRVHTLALDLDVAALWTGHVRVRRAEVDGVRMRLLRDAHGGLHVPGLPEGTAPPPPATLPATPPAPEALLDVSLPVEVVALRLHDAELIVEDRAGPAHQPSRYRAELAATHLQHPHLPGEVHLQVTAPDQIDLIRLEARGRVGERHLEAELEVQIAGVDPEAVAHRLGGVVLGLPVHVVDGRWRLAARIEPRAGDPLRADAELRVTEGWVRADGEPVVRVEELRATGRGLTSAGLDSGDLAVRLALPGTAERLALQGTLQPPGTRPRARCALQAEGMTLARLQPLLARAGMTSELRSGALRLTAEGDLSTEADGTRQLAAEVRGLELRDGEPLLALDRIAVVGMALDAPGTDLGELLVEGLDLPVRRDPQGRLHLLGLRLGDAAAVARPGPVPADAPASAAGRRGQEPFRLRRLSASGLVPRYRDESVDPPLDLALESLAIDVRGLATGSPGAPPARLLLDASGNGPLESLRLEGTLDPNRPDRAMAMELGLAARVRPTAFAAHLAQLGLAPGGPSLAADLKVRGEWRADGGATRAAAELSDVVLRAEGEPEWRLARVTLRDLRADASGVRIGALESDGPRLVLRRDAEGRVLLPGLRSLPVAAATRASHAQAAAAPVATMRPATAPASQAAPAALTLARVDLAGVELAWHDATTGIATALAAELAARDLTLGSASSGTLALRLVDRASGAHGSLEARLRSDPRTYAAEAELRLADIAPAPYAPYLPEGLTPVLAKGSLHLGLAAQIETVAAGGHALSLQLRDLALTGAGQDRPLLALASARVIAPRIDPAGGVVQLAEVVVEGAEASVKRVDVATFEALGMRIAPPPPGPATEGEGEASEAAATQAWAAAAATGPPLPKVTLERLVLDLKEVRFQDTHGRGIPLTAALRIDHEAPLVLLDRHPEDLAALPLRIRGRADPLCDRLELDLRVAPFEGEPELAFALGLHGIRGTRLLEVLPGLRGEVDATALSDGELTVTGDAQVKVRRRSPLRPDFSRGFGLRANLRDLRFRAAPEGEVLAGLDAVRVEVQRVQPAGGGVHVRRIEVDQPRGRVRLDQEGLHLLGLRLPLGATGEAPAAEPVPAAVQATRPDAAELRIDEVAVQGIDFVFTDARQDPPVVVPLTDLELKLSGWSTRALREPRPLSFSLRLSAGEIDLPQRLAAVTPLLGMLGAAARVVTLGGKEAVTLEKRPLFGEIAVQGRLVLAPTPTGVIKTNVAAFELPALRGLARAAGIEIGDGIADAGVTLRLRPERQMAVNADFTFTSLSLREPAGGPISRYLKLPAPLDTVLFVLSNERDQVHVPLSFTSAFGGPSSQEIFAKATETLAVLITKSIARSPLRVAAIGTDLLGLGGGPATAAKIPPVDLGFGPGDAHLAAEARTALARVVEVLDDDDGLVAVLEHSFGAEDHDRLRTRANPTREELLALATLYRWRSAELRREQDLLVAQLRSLLAAGGPEEAEAVRARLEAVTRNQGRMDDGLAETARLLRPGAERQIAARARRVGLDLAELRLAVVRQALLRTDLPHIEVRVEERRAGSQTETDQPGGRVRVSFQPRRAQ
ncbi:MAG: DUF748 domain-containing protein [Planctomycetes bacterium]|nr:DUF748 domain-containing protein [Planctomycetota bacterium]